MTHRLLPLLLIILLNGLKASACEAYFTWQTDGMTINLDGSESAGDISQWRWYMNGDLFSDTPLQTHKTVSEYGEYEFCLVIETFAGCTDTFCQTISVEPSDGDCEAHFSWWLDGNTIHLNGSESTGDVVSWHWYLDEDLFSDAGPETQVTAGESGEHHICLVIETATGCVDTLCQAVVIDPQNGDCQAHFSWTIDGYVIHLNGSESTGDVISWHWYLDGGLFSQSGPETQVTADESGEHHVCLRIETSTGCVDSLCAAIVIDPQQDDCAAFFSWWLDGLTIHLNGNESTGDVVSWQWYLDGNLFSDDGPETHVTVDESGEHHVCLIIETASGCFDTLCQAIVIGQETDCTAHFSWWLDGFTIHLNGNESTGDVVSWHWYLDDVLASDDGPETHVTANESGEHHICLVIETASGCVDTICQAVEIGMQNDDCAAHFSAETDGFNIYLNGSESEGEILHWFWYINGEFFSDSHPTTQLTLGESGEYEICLVIQADGGCSDTTCSNVEVEGFSGNQNEFRVFVSDNGLIVLQVNVAEDGSCLLLFNDPSGREVFSTHQMLNKGSAQKQIWIGSMIPSGIYLATFYFNNQLVNSQKVAILHP